MSRRGETGFLPVFFLLVALVVGAFLSKDRFFQWNYLQPTIRTAYFFIWLMLVFALILLVLFFAVSQRKLRRERLKMRLLFLALSMCVLCLFIEGWTWLEFHGGPACFPYNLGGQLSFQPPFLPLSLNIDNQGQISVSADASISFEIGTVSVSVDSGGLPTVNNNSDDSITTLIIRHHQEDQIVDTSYLLHSPLDSVQVSSTGYVVTTIKKNYYFIDASRGTIEHTQVNIIPSNSNCQVSPPS